MIRVGIECEQLEQNRFGVGHTLAQLLRALTAVPHIEDEFKFVLYFKKEIPQDEFLRHPLFEAKVLMRDTKLFNVSFNIFYHVLLPWRYWRDKLDVFLFPSNMLPAFFFGKAIVVLVNDVYWEAHHGTIPFRYRISYLMFCWWAAKRATIMTISEFSKKELRRFYRIPENRIFANPWGIEKGFRALPRTKEYTKKIAELKETFGIHKDFLLSVGQAFPRRHMKEAVEAFGSIAAEYPFVQYLVACTDKYNPPMLAELIHEENKKTGKRAIVYASYLNQDDVPYMMSEAKALLYVSSKEALGLPPIEAVRCGTPVIVADTPTTREFFGERGFFVPSPHSPREIAHYMKEVLAHEKEARAITQTQAQRLSKLNWESHTQKLLTVLHEIAHKDR